MKMKINWYIPCSTIKSEILSILLFCQYGENLIVSKVLQWTFFFVFPGLAPIAIVLKNILKKNPSI